MESRSETETFVRYHVPRSQVWEGSRGRQQGNVHIHVRNDFDSGNLHRKAGQALCSTRPAWYERFPDPSETDLCARCAEIANRHRLYIRDIEHESLTV